MGIFANLSANRKIIKRLETLEEDQESFAKACRRFEGLETEFSALWGKVNRALGRIEKRAATIEAHDNPEEGDADAPDGPSSPELGLTPKQLQWQKQIERERRRLT